MAIDGGQQGAGWREDLLVGRIDASCILVHGLIPEANQGTIMSVPLPTADPHPWRLARERTGAADHSTAPSRSVQQA
ncbi:hypothetical protein ACQEVY_09185 [Streptomyces sp. CA-288835]|uniref:hypothetical protein n=1 Tax=Streptomyces sp. CA-288835 TaxID=3240069 RepID=UPI003D8CF2C8